MRAGSGLIAEGERYDRAELARGGVVFRIDHDVAQHDTADNRPAFRQGEQPVELAPV